MPALYTFFSWFLLLFGVSSDCPDTTHIDADLDPMPASCFFIAEEETPNPPPFVFDTNISNGI